MLEIAVFVAIVAVPAAFILLALGLAGSLIALLAEQDHLYAGPHRTAV